MTTLYTFTAPDITGHERSLAVYRGQVVLIVNVASRCGFTQQYRVLETLHRTYREQGLVVLGFPCNQFAGQEPAQEAEILDFCRSHYDVTFALFSKIAVNGSNAHPLYQWLKQEQPGMLGSTAIKWNFTKFLIGRDGHVRKRYAPISRPLALRTDIVAALAQPSPPSSPPRYDSQPVLRHPHQEYLP